MNRFSSISLSIRYVDGLIATSCALNINSIYSLKKGVCMEAAMKYASIGVCNTLLHWMIFFSCYSLFGLGQAGGNVIVFLRA